MSRSLVVILLLALAVAACGRKGDLQPPPGYEEEQPAEETG